MQDFVETVKLLLEPSGVLLFAHQIRRAVICTVLQSAFIFANLSCAMDLICCSKQVSSSLLKEQPTSADYMGQEERPAKVGGI